MTLKERARAFYERHEMSVDLAFFVGGFVFDIFTLSDIDDPLAILQQVVYLSAIGAVLYAEFLEPLGKFRVPERIKLAWENRELVIHFILGSLLSTYSLFFLKSSSLFSSAVFVAVLLILMVLNELKPVQRSPVNIKMGLYMVCVFSFFSMMVPVALGFVGLIPFSLAILLTGLVIYLAYRSLLARVGDGKLLLKRLVGPGLTVLMLSQVFYWVGWIPPVPLSVQSMGVYHGISRSGDKYMLAKEERDWKAKIPHVAGPEFLAEPGDKIHFFARIFSPSRFSDSVVLHWYFKNVRGAWESTDKIPMRISGGRKGGYRGYSIKQNYQPGRWRVSVETTDGREIGRYYFRVAKAEAPNLVRRFEQEAQ